MFAPPRLALAHTGTFVAGIALERLDAVLVGVRMGADLDHFTT